MPHNTFNNLNKDKKDNIDNILLNIFTNNDISNITVSSIVKEMKMSRGAFYKYFIDLEDAYQYITNKAITTIHNSILEEIILNKNNLFVGLKSYITSFSKLNKNDLLYRYFILLTTNQNSHLEMNSNFDYTLWNNILTMSNLTFESDKEKISYLIFIMNNIMNILKYSIVKKWNSDELLMQYNYFINWLK